MVHTNKATATAFILKFVIVIFTHNPIYIYWLTWFQKYGWSLRSDTFPCQSAVTCQWIPPSHLSLSGCYLVFPHHYNHPSWISQLRYVLWYCPSPPFFFPDGKNKILSCKQWEQAVNINGNTIYFSLNRSCRLLILWKFQLNLLLRMQLIDFYYFCPTLFKKKKKSKSAFWHFF